MAGIALIVAEAAGERRDLARTLAAEGWPVEEAAGLAPALARLAEGPPVDLVVIRVADGADGLQPLAELRRARPSARIVVVSGDGRAASAVLALKAGAADYLVVPVAAAALARAAGPARSEKAGLAALVAGAPAMAPVLRLAQRAAASRLPVLVLGESGTGKERVARAIHAASDRAGAPFVAVNCGALPEHLVESLLFGHEKGAFTGADSRQEGRFRAADGGTIFLDEVGDLPPPAQVKLLRVLQEGEVDPVGARRPVPVDVRVISATNRDLRAGQPPFREDLYFRLAGVELRLPPLRDRREDIAPLALAHAEAVARLEGRRFEGFAPGVADWLAAQPWPGNVRELQNAVHRAMILSESPLLPLEAFGTAGAARAPVPAADAAGPRPAPDRVRPLAEIEAEAIADALLLCGGRISEAARRLGIGRSTLYRKMEEYGLGPAAGRPGREAG